MSRTVKKTPLLFVDVIQNGSTIASARFKVGHRKTLRVTRHPGYPLSVPFYPLAHELEVFHIRRKYTRLLLNEPWQGFLSLRGEELHLNPHDRSERTFDLNPGDYGSIYRHDLRLVFRVGQPVQVKGTPWTGRDLCGGSFWGMIFRGKAEAQSMLIAGALGLLVVGGLWAGIRKVHLTRPETLADLSPEYGLPFLDPTHLLTIPEALQDNLNRKNYIRGTLNFYSAVSEMLTSPEGPSPRLESLMYQSSRDVYKEAHTKFHGILASLSDKQRATRAQTLARPAARMIAVPAIVGEPLHARQNRLIDKIQIIHDALSKQEQARAAADVKVESVNEGTAKLAAGARQAAMVESDSENMQRVARELAQQATWLQARARASEDSLERSGRLAQVALIGLEPTSETIDFLTPEAEAMSRMDLPTINAATYGQRKEEKIREPLVGEIEPSRIEAIVSKNRYQLQLCFENGLRKHPDLAGSVEWQWRIDSRGDISDLALTRSTLSNDLVLKCMREKISGWRFPRPRKGSVEIRYPFEFKPDRG